MKVKRDLFTIYRSQPFSTILRLKLRFCEGKTGYILRFTEPFSMILRFCEGKTGYIVRFTEPFLTILRLILRFCEGKTGNILRLLKVENGLFKQV